MSEDLKPCPFCGGEGEAVCLRICEDTVASWVRCLSCGARTDEIEAAYSDLPSAKATWNTRALSLPTPTIDREAIAREGAEEVVGAMLAAITYSTQPENVAKLAPTYIEDRARLAMTRILALLHPIDDISETERTEHGN